MVLVLPSAALLLLLASCCLERVLLPGRMRVAGAAATGESEPMQLLLPSSTSQLALLLAASGAEALSCLLHGCC